MKKLKRKRILVLLTLFILTTLIMATPAYAQDDQILNNIDKANNLIDQLIKQTQFTAEIVIDKAPGEVQNQIVQNLTNSLIKQTDTIVNNFIMIGDNKGISIDGYYEDVEIGGQIVSIDPLVHY